MNDMRTKGFTLIEFLLYFGLLAMVMGAVTVFTVDVVRSRNKTRVVAEVEQNARFGMSRILRSVRQADALDVGGSTFDADAGVLSLEMSAPAADPTVFDLSDGVLRITEGAGPATALTTDDVVVTKLRFSRDSLPGGSRAVTVELGLRYATEGVNVDFNYATSATGTAVIRKQ